MRDDILVVKLLFFFGTHEEMREILLAPCSICAMGKPPCLEQPSYSLSVTITLVA